MEDQRKDNERLSTELTKKNNQIAELQTQQSKVKMKSEVQVKQLQRRMELIREANKWITELLATLQEGSQKAIMQVKKINRKTPQAD